MWQVWQKTNKMKVIDTNILLRFFVDDPDDIQSQQQKPIAKHILSQPSFIPLTVILEFEWAMRGFYQLSKTQIAQIFAVLFAYPHIHIEDKNSVMTAVDLSTKGMDFADALHLCHNLNYQGMITFDNRFYKKATQLSFDVQLADENWMIIHDK